MDKHNSDSIVFSYVTFDQIDKIQDLHPLVYKLYVDENQKFSKFEYLRSCPDISDGFPCFFYLTDKDKVIATICSIPDKLYMHGEVFPWAWAGALFTDADYRGKGLATLLVKNMVNILHEQNMAWGAVFSTLIALRIYQKLNFTIPGYANRYLLPKTIEPLLGYYLKSNTLISVLNIPFRVALRTILLLINRPLPPNKFDVTVRRADIDNEDLSDKRLPQLHYHTPYHFNDNLDKIKWKMSTTKDTVLYFITNKLTNEYLCYFILKNRTNQRAYAGKLFEFKVMTLMDYGVYSDDINTYEALMSSVFSLFWNSDAELFEVISSSPILNPILKRNGMFKFKGMSFKFCAPQNWKCDQECVVLRNWPLTHFNGDGFSFL